MIKKAAMYSTELEGRLRFKKNNWAHWAAVQLSFQSENTKW